MDTSSNLIPHPQSTDHTVTAVIAGFLAGVTCTLAVLKLLGE
jgi:hypothetical protein